MRISKQLLAHLHSDWVICFNSGGGGRAPRTQLSIWAMLSRGGSQLNEEKFDVEVAELSATGAGLVQDQEITVGEQVVLHLRKDEGPQVEILCVVRRTEPVGDGKIFAGVEFLQFQEDAFQPADADWQEE